VLAFIWMYLLVREIGEEGSSVSRAALAEEIFPGLASRAQRERLRDRLRDARQYLPPRIAASVVVTGDTVSFDVRGWAIDALQLRTAARRAREGEPGSVSDGQDRWQGVLLPEWEELAVVTEGRGSSGELIEQLRLDLEGDLVGLLAVDAEAELTAGRAEAAVRLAERARTLRPDREDVRRVLTRAYAETGRHEAADTVRDE